MNLDTKHLNILICDDSITNVLLLSSLLESEGYTSITTLTDPTRVLSTLQDKKIDLLLLDIEMPEMDGFQVMQQISESPVKNDFIPVLVLTGHQGTEIRNRALESGAQDFLNKPFDHTEVILRVRNLLRVRSAYLAQANHAVELEKRVEERTAELNRATDILIERMAMAGEMRDTDTGNHVLRVGHYARILANACGLPPSISYMIQKAAPLHDLGKIGIPDSILLKPGKLTDEEREIMKQHTEKGANLLANHDSLVIKMAASIAHSHHEHWDGQGYPRGLAGEAIPIEGRITAISDVFDALTTTRPYKDAWSIDAAVDFIQQGASKQFDPNLVRLFTENLEQIAEIRQQYDDNAGVDLARSA